MTETAVPDPGHIILNWWREMTQERALVLLLFHDHGIQTRSDIAKRVCEDEKLIAPSSLSPILEWLRERNLLDIIPEKGPRKPMRITPDGQDVLRRYFGTYSMRIDE